MRSPVSRGVAAAATLLLVATGAATASAAPAGAAVALRANAATLPSFSWLPVHDAAATLTDTGAYELHWLQSAGVRQVAVHAATRPGVLPGSSPTVAVSSSGAAVVSGLDSSRRWYFTLVADNAPIGLEVATRFVPVDGVVNTRDVGGYAAIGGFPVQWGRVFRSGNFATASPQGVATVAGLGLHQVIDFRTPSEIAVTGQNHLPAGVAEVSEPIGAPPGYTPTGIPDEYRLLVADPAIRASLGDAMRHIADAGPMPVALVDQGGNNRVGWAVAVLLSAAGVPRDVIYRDYLLSTTVQASYLDTAFHEADAEFGSMSGYLTQGLGLDPITLLRLKIAVLLPAWPTAR